MNNIDQMINNAQSAANATPSSPAAPASTGKLVMIATDFSYEAYIQAGHNDETLVRDGLAKIEAAPAAPAPSAPAAPAAPASPASPATPNSPVAYQAPEQNTAMVDPAMLAPMDMSMDAMMAQGFSVDAWVKTGFHGLALEDKLCQGFKAVIKMIDGQGFKPCQSIRYGTNPVNYDKTFDGITAEDGSPWANKIMAARGIDPKCRPYRSVQIAMELLEDAVALDGKTVLAKAGSVVGYATSVTGWGEWESFYRSCVSDNRIGSDVEVSVSNVSKEKGANQWGIMRWELAIAEGLIPDQEELNDAEAAEAEAKLSKSKTKK